MKSYLDEQDQHMLINLMISDSMIFSRCRSILKPEYFDKKFQKSIEYLLDYTNTYNSLPTIEQLNNESRIEFKIINGIQGNLSHCQSVLDTCEAFCKKKALELAIFECNDRISKGETTGIDSIIKEAQMISLKKDVGINFWQNQDEWLNKLEVEMGSVPTGWKEFDNMIGGNGFSWGQLIYIVSASGGGKSLAMTNLALNFSCQGMNVLYITLELDKELVGKRLMAMASNIGYKDIRSNKKQVIESLIYKRKDIKPGILQIAELPIGSTTLDIETLLQTLEVSTGQEFNIIVVDYADLLSPNDKRINVNDLHLVGTKIAENLRSISRERTHNDKKTLVITASQVTKDAMAEEEYTMSNISGSTGKSNTADLIFSVRTTTSLKQQGLYEIKFLKARNAGCVDKKMKLRYNVDSLLMSGLEEVKDNTKPNNNVNSALATLASIKGKL